MLSLRRPFQIKPIDSELPPGERPLKRVLSPVTVQVDVFANYGRPNEQRKSLTLWLKEAQETVCGGEIEF